MHSTWKKWLFPVLDSPQHQVLLDRIKQQEDEGVCILPAPESRLRVFLSDPLSLRVVILGQDPYPTPGHAMGLAFSVNFGVSVPRSLRNIYKEIEQDGGQSAKGRDGDLTSWEDQGVFLLNSILTVQAGHALSHSGWGWESLTQLALSSLSENHPGLVFMLWGSEAQKIARRASVDQGKHLLLQTSHPSPLSVYRGFSGSGVFSKANEWLDRSGRSTVIW